MIFSKLVTVVCACFLTSGRELADREEARQNLIFYHTTKIHIVARVSNSNEHLLIFHYFERKN